MSDKKIKELERELEKVKQQAKEYLEGWQRAKADYINREREIERQQSEWLEFANVSLILEFLPIYEHLCQALEYKNTNEDFMSGIEQIKKQFENSLKKVGLEKIKTVGEKFNPEFHEAVEKRGEGNQVIEEVSTGYKINGKVIKIAKVIIQ